MKVKKEHNGPHMANISHQTEEWRCLLIKVRSVSKNKHQQLLVFADLRKYLKKNELALYKQFLSDHLFTFKDVISQNQGANIILNIYIC